jgi:hypothetical protein
MPLETQVIVTHMQPHQQSIFLPFLLIQEKKKERELQTKNKAFFIKLQNKKKDNAQA